MSLMSNTFFSFCPEILCGLSGMLVRIANRQDPGNKQPDLRLRCLFWPLSVRNFITFSCSSIVLLIYF